MHVNDSPCRVCMCTNKSVCMHVYESVCTNMNVCCVCMCTNKSNRHDHSVSMFLLCKVITGNIAIFLKRYDTVEGKESGQVKGTN